MRKYEITTFYADNVPYQKALMISLEYRDWCEFETTPLYQTLISYLEALEIPDQE